jgi:Zn-finger nucleic acid-binding protein
MLIMVNAKNNDDKNFNDRYDDDDDKNDNDDKKHKKYNSALMSIV